MMQQPHRIEEKTPFPTFEAGGAAAPPVENAALTFSSEELAEREALLRRLRKKRSFVQQETSLFATDPFTPEKFSALLRRLRDPNPRRWRERILAIGTLGCLPLNSNEKQLTVQILEKILANTQELVGDRVASRSPDAYKVAYLIAFSLFLILMAREFWGVDASVSLFDLLGELLLSCVFGAIFIAFVAFPAAAFVLPVYAAADVSRQNRIRAAAATALARIGQPESMGVVAQTLCDVSPLVRHFAHEALRALHPRLTSDYYGRLDSALTPNLCRALRQESRKHEPVSAVRMIALLQALEKVGDGRAVEPVRALTNAAYYLRIGQEAERILPVLEARLRQENDSKMLLRGASTPATKSEELLRAAVTSVEKKPEQLLRIPAEETENPGRSPDSH